MKQHRIPAVFVRGGTSKGILLQAHDLPDERRRWDPIFLSALGSPDPYGRQLDGMGGGLSSLSKICIMAPPTRADADIDYTFAQVLIQDSHVDYNALCGNMSSAVGPFAVDEGLVGAAGDCATVRIHNTNTKKIISATFPLEDGLAAVEGDLTIPGVDGQGAPVRLDFLDPGGATTGRLLPTGQVAQTLDVPGHGSFEVSMVDASNACVFLRAQDLGLTGVEMPAEIEANTRVMATLAAIRLAASVAMGVAGTPEEAARKTAVPFVGFVAAPRTATTLAGETIEGGEVDLVARIVSNGQLHRALPLGASMCLAVAARIAGSVVHDVTRAAPAVHGMTHADPAVHGVTHADPRSQALRVSMPSGVLQVAADVVQREGEWHALRGGFYRTQRRLFEGHVLVRGGAFAR